MDKRFRFSIDRGGTFTDLYCEVISPNKPIEKKVVKLLSEDPSNYNDAPTEGIRKILEQEIGIEINRKSPVPTSQIEYIRMGTTVATNALLERKGERVALLTTKGFSDLQRIGNQARPKIFDLEIKRPDLLYEYVVELNERVVLVKDGENFIKSSDVYSKSKEFIGISQEKVYVEEDINEDEVKKHLNKILSMGIDSYYIFLFKFIFYQHF
jgi:5-oxoprolinase (ATP-hydrolysing)